MDKNPSNPKKILFIEDDLLLRELYHRSLTKSGYQVVVAEDGQEGLDMADKEPFDLILLDIMMPKMHGIDVLRHLKINVKTKNIPVFLLTNLGQESVIQEGFELGAIAYLIKAKLLPADIVKQVDDFFATGMVAEASLKI